MSSIIQKDTYNVTFGEQVWYTYQQDPDTGYFFWGSDVENWEEI